MINRRRLPNATTTAPPILFVLLISLFLVSSASAQITAGSITAINGNGTITRATRTFPATYGTPIDVGDRVVTANNGRLTITLSDGSQLELTESSTLLMSQDLLNPNGTRAGTTVTLLDGLVRSLVRVTAGTPPNYEVHTPNAVASARGTTYDTYHTDNGNRSGFPGCKEFTDVLVYDGTVNVSSLANPSSPAVQLHSGQKTTVPCGLATLPASALAAIGGSAGAGGLSVGAVAAASAGGFAGVTGGVVGGVAAAGGFSSNSPSSSPSVSPVTPSM